MKNYPKIIYIIISLLTLTLIFTFKSIPSGKLWKKYNIIYADINSSDSVVTKALQDSKIKDYVCLSNQFIPANLSENSPELTMLRIDKDNPYLQKRNEFFFDKNHNYRLYYVPHNEVSKLSSCVSILKDQNINCGLDTNSSYPLLVPLFIIIFASILLYFVKNKAVFLIPSVFSVCFSICNPFYSVAAALILIELLFFIFAVLWKREGCFDFLKGKKLLLAMLGISILTIFTSSLITIVIFIFYFAGIYSSLTIFSSYEDRQLSRKPFQSVKILPAKRISIFQNKAKYVIPFSISFIAILFLIALISSFGKGGFSISGLQFPGRSSANVQTLPQFDDYYKWNWSVKTSPYKSINSEDNEQNQISFPDYEIKDGKITVTNKTLSYNQDFKNQTYDDIDKLKFNSVEKVMKSEGENFACGYVSLNSYTINAAGIIMILICLFILLFIYFSSIIKKGFCNGTVRR